MVLMRNEKNYHQILPFILSIMSSGPNEDSSDSSL